MLNLRENEVITLTATDGSEIELEYMACAQYECQTYAAFYPVPENDEDILDADYDMLILRVSEEDGAQAFDLVEEEDLLEPLGEIFMDLIFGEE